MTSEPRSTSPGGSASDRVNGERVGRLIRLKPEYRERYIVLHKHTFPEVLDQIRTSNVRNYSIFLRDGLLFSFFEYVGTDYEADMEAMAENSTVQEWWTLTDPMQESLASEEADEWWVTMEEVYHRGPKRHASSDTEKRAYVRRLHDAPAEAVRAAYGEVDAALEEALEAAELQNYAVYSWGDRVCTYMEASGDEPASAVEWFRNTPALQTIDERLAPRTRTPGRPMESVFYTP